MLDMLTRLLVLASLPLRLRERAGWWGGAGTGVSNELVPVVVVGGAREGGGAGWEGGCSGGRMGRLVRGSLGEGVVPLEKGEG